MGYVEVGNGNEQNVTQLPDKTLIFMKEGSEVPIMRRLFSFSFEILEVTRISNA